MVSAAYQGFSPFRRHHRVVHWLGYLSGIAIYLGAYALFAWLSPFSGRITVAATATVAGCLLGVYTGWLYGRAIGSPYGNVLLALVTPSLVPGVFYTAPLPGTTLPGGTWAHPELVVGAALAGLLAALWTIRQSYASVADIAAWEDDVLPYGFRMVDDEWLAEQPSVGTGRSAGRPQLKPRSELRMEPRLDVRGWLVGLVFVVPVVALAAYGAVTYDDRAFSGIMLLAMFVMLHWGLTVEGEP